MNPFIDCIKANIAVRPIFVCSVCDDCKLGGTVHYNFFALNGAELTEQINSIEVRSCYMPTGWSSYPNKVFKCAKCIII